MKNNNQISFRINIPKVGPLIRLALGFIALVPTSTFAQTYIYTYTGSDFTSVFNAPNEMQYGFVPYTTSSKVTGSIALSAPLGDNYNGSPSATVLSFLFSDGVGPQNIGGSSFAFPYVMDSTFSTDSSGNIVSWNFQVTAFIGSSPAESKTIQTENEPGNVIDSGNLNQPLGIVGQGSVSSNPGMWVETVVPEPSVGSLLVSFGAVALAFRRFKSNP